MHMMTTALHYQRQKDINMRTCKSLVRNSDIYSHILREFSLGISEGAHRVPVSKGTHI